MLRLRLRQGLYLSSVRWELFGNDQNDYFYMEIIPVKYFSDSFGEEMNDRKRGQSEYFSSMWEFNFEYILKRWNFVGNVYI